MLIQHDDVSRLKDRSVNNDDVAKTCPGTIMTHKTGYADAVGKPEFADTGDDDVITARVKGGFGLGLC